MARYVNAAKSVRRVQLVSHALSISTRLFRSSMFWIRCSMVSITILTLSPFALPSYYVLVRPGQPNHSATCAGLPAKGGCHLGGIRYPTVNRWLFYFPSRTRNISRLSRSTQSRRGCRARCLTAAGFAKTTTNHRICSAPYCATPLPISRL